MLDTAVLISIIGLDEVFVDDYIVTTFAAADRSKLTGVRVNGGIDLAGGYDTITVGGNTNMTITGPVSGISYFNTAAGMSFNYILNCSYSKATWGDAAVANSYENSNYVQLFTTVSVGGDYTAAASANTINLGSYSKVSITGNIVNSDTSTGSNITVGAASTLSANTIYGLASLNLIYGMDTYVQKRVYNSSWVPADTLADGRTYVNILGNSLEDEDENAVYSIIGTNDANYITVNGFTGMTTKGGIDLLGGANSLTVNAQGYLNIGSASVSADLVGVQYLNLSGGGWTYNSVNSEATVHDIWLGTIKEMNYTTGLMVSKNVYMTRAELTVSGNYIGQDGYNSISVGTAGKFTVGGYIGESEGGGTFSVNVGSNSTMTVGGEIENVTSLNISGGYTYSYQITAGDTNQWVSTQGITSFSAGSVLGTKQAEYYSIGDYSNVSVGSFDLGDGNDTIYIGANSMFSASTIDFGSGRNSLTVGSNTVGQYNKVSDSKGTTCNEQYFVVSSISGVNTLTVNAGGVWSNSSDGWKPHQAWTSFTVNEVTGAYEESWTTKDNVTTGTITYLDDSITVNNFVKASFGSIDLSYGKNRISVGSNSKMAVLGDVNGINNLTLSAGYTYTDTLSGVQSQVQGRTVLDIQGDLTGSKSPDSRVYPSGSIPWGDETKSGVMVDNTNDAITLGNYTEMILRGDAVGIDNLSLANGYGTETEMKNNAAKLFASTDAVTKLMKASPAWGTTTNNLYDIGAAGTSTTTGAADYFSDSTQELADNTATGAAAEGKTMYSGENGWLSSGGSKTVAETTHNYFNDSADFFALDGVTNDLTGWKLTSAVSKADGLEVGIYYNTDGASDNWKLLNITLTPADGWGKEITGGYEWNLGIEKVKTALTLQGAQAVMVSVSLKGSTPIAADGYGVTTYTLAKG